MHFMCGYDIIIFKKEISQHFNDIILWYNNNSKIKSAKE